MENQNIIIFLDKIKKNLELGMVPQTIMDIQMLIKELEITESKKKGKIILPLNNEFSSDVKTLSGKVNEIISFINNRFTY